MDSTTTQNEPGPVERGFVEALAIARAAYRLDIRLYAVDVTAYGAAVEAHVSINRRDRAAGATVAAIDRLADDLGLSDEHITPFVPGNYRRRGTLGTLPVKIFGQDDRHTACHCDECRGETPPEPLPHNAERDTNVATA